MKIETWEIYWIFKLDDIHGWLEGVALLLGFICCLLVIFSFVGTTLCLDGTDSDKKVKSRLYKATLFAFILFIFVSIGNVFLPTTKQMVAIKVLPAIVNSEAVQKGLPDELNMLYSITKEFLKKKMVEEGGEMTNFENVTKTPETLAEESVYVVYDKYSDGTEWMSVFVNGAWRTWEEAVAATLEWLKKEKEE